MSTIQIKGILTEDGKIEIDLPDGWQPGEVSIEINIKPTFTDAELDELMQFHPGALGEIDAALLGAGADWDIGDSAEWVEEQRSKRRKKWMD